MIPVCNPILDDIEAEAALKTVQSGWIGGIGPNIEAFEKAWADYCGRKHGVAVNNGTSALIAAVHALDLPSGSEILIPSFTIISCALAAIYNGCKPIFVDVDPEYWNIDQYQIINHLTDKTKAIMPVHMYGHPANMDHIISLANTFKLHIIEDAAQAHGASYNQLGMRRMAGSQGSVSCFSFYSNKLISTGEGGMILTDNEEYAERMRNYRNLCFGKGNKRFEHVGLGNNLRMTNIQAAIGLAQMTKLTWQLDKKRHLKTRYKEGLKKLPIRFQKDRHGYESSHWMTGILIDGNASELIDFLRSNNIEARPFFSDLNNHFYGKRLPTSSLLAHKGLYLPSSSDISEDSLDKVISAIYDFYN